LKILKEKLDENDPREDYNYCFMQYFDKLVEHRKETGAIKVN
jgi:hypothetical protein